MTIARLITLYALIPAAIGCGDASLGSAGLQSDASVDAAPPLPCVEGDLQFLDDATGTCYMFFSEGAEWSAASAACSDIEAHLVTSTSDDENALILGMAPLGTMDVWMGGSDSEVEMTWEWVTQEPMGYQGWRIDEPNNGGDVGGNEDCMIMEVDRGGTWDDRPCAQVYPYFCERSPGGPS